MPIAALASPGGTDTAATSGDTKQPDDFFSSWFAMVSEAQDEQPHWMTPVATVTPRLEQEFRYDQSWQHLGNGAQVNNFDAGKGLELIPTPTNEVLLNLPPFEERGIKKPADGFGDWPVLTVKQRLASANESNGNYIVTAFLGVQAPIGASAFTNHAWVVTPTLAAGKGWGNFDIQATVGVPVPTSHEDLIGTSIVSNVALQFHIAEYLWPELEFNDTYWADGQQRGGKNQLFLTPGLVLGRFLLGGRTKAIIGAGYQIALSPALTTKPVLTPTYEHAWILSARLAF